MCNSSTENASTDNSKAVSCDSDYSSTDSEGPASDPPNSDSATSTSGKAQEDDIGVQWGAVGLENRCVFAFIRHENTKSDERPDIDYKDRMSKVSALRL